MTMSDASGVVGDALAEGIASFLRGIAKGTDDKSTFWRLSHQFLRDIWLHEQHHKPPKLSAPLGEVKDSLDGLELVLARIASMSGIDSTLRVQDAKKWLREQGEHGKTIASMFGSLSKVRNAQAHPRAFKILASLELLAEKSQMQEADKQAPEILAVSPRESSTDADWGEQDVLQMKLLEPRRLGRGALAGSLRCDN